MHGFGSESPSLKDKEYCTEKIGYPLGGKKLDPTPHTICTKLLSDFKKSNEKPELPNYYKRTQKNI